MEQKQPTRAHGKICYMEIPALDIKQSADFYKKVFNWQIREDSDGSIAFDDAVGEVSGMWVTHIKPATEGGVVISIMVDDISTAKEAITANGGSMADPSSDTSRTALFRDPAGNLFCLYQSSRR